MKIFGICLTKNEADIIEEVLTKASNWCDKIFIFDTGSTDQTWEKIIELSKHNTHLIPFKKEVRSFRDELRGEVFNNYRHLARDGDWWCRLDADEVYIDNPKLFLKQISALHHVVWNLSFQFYFTEEDLKQYEKNPAHYLGLEVESRLKYYVCNHSEIRFFKYRSKLNWDNGSWPRHVGLVSPKRIRLKHLQYRSPEQIQFRLDTRRQAILEGYKVFEAYTSESTWREKICNSKDYNYFYSAEECIVDPQKLPSYLESRLTRVAKYLLHGLKIYP